MQKIREDYSRIFHEKLKQEINAEPIVKLLKFHRTLIDEETKELIIDIRTNVLLYWGNGRSKKEAPCLLY